MNQRVADLQLSYDEVAEEYVARIYHELEHKPTGFAIEDVIERPPYESVEAQTRRAYMFARKPAVASSFIRE